MRPSLFKIVLLLFSLFYFEQSRSQKLLLDTIIEGHRLKFSLLNETSSIQHNKVSTYFKERANLLLKVYDTPFDTLYFKRYKRIDSLESLWLKETSTTYRKGNLLNVKCADSLYTFTNEFEADGMIYNAYVFLGSMDGFQVLLNLGYEWGGFVFIASPNLEAASPYNSGFDIIKNVLAYSDFNYFNYDNPIRLFQKKKGKWNETTLVNVLRRFRFLCTDISILNENKIILNGSFLNANSDPDIGGEFNPEKKTIQIDITSPKNK